MNSRERLVYQLNWCIKQANNEGKNSWEDGFAFANQLYACKIFEILMEEGIIKEVIMNEEEK